MGELERRPNAWALTPLVVFLLTYLVVSIVAGIYLEPVRYIFGDRAGHDEGDRIVGRAEVGETYQGRYAHLGPLGGMDAGGKLADDPVDTPVITDHLQHASCQKRHDNQLAHIRDT